MKSETWKQPSKKFSTAYLSPEELSLSATRRATEAEARRASFTDLISQSCDDLIADRQTALFA